jgi:hypothetical protein
MSQVRQMWEGGPLRQFSETAKGWIPYSTGGYVGSYVCRACFSDCKGVYEPEWRCAACNAKFRPKTGKKGHPTTPLDLQPVSEGVAV